MSHITACRLPASPLGLGTDLGSRRDPDNH